jgi:hypothetical protein
MRFMAVSRLVVLAGLLAGCGGGDDLLLPGSEEPATVTLLQGDQQNGRVGEPLPQPLVAEVKDRSARPVDGATVVFVLADPAPGASVTPDTVTTDANGQASASITLGTRPGTQAGEVRALGGGGAPTATKAFTLTAVSENANGISSVGGEDQSAPVGSTLPQPLVVEVADAFGNPIAGVTVAWSIEGGGSVSDAATVTGDDGRTSVTRTLGGTAGLQRTLATVDGLAGSPVAFVHNATAGSASGVTIVSGDDQTGPVSTELPQPVVVEVRDEGNNPVPNVAVTWVIGSGGGTVTPATSTTDASGRASAAWTLGSVPGPNTLSAVVSGIGVGEFSATATAGAPARLTVLTQPSSTAVSGVVLSQQPVIQLLDAGGNESKQAGVAVQVALGSGSGSLAGPTTATTDAGGRAFFTGLAIIGGNGTHTLRFSANGFASVTSAQIALSAANTVTTITADTPDPSQAGAQVTVQFTVTADAGTPTGSVRVRDGGDECTGALSGGQGSCVITLSNTGSRTLTAEYQGADGFGKSSDTESHTVEAPPTPDLVVARQPSSTAVVGVPFDQQPVVQLQDGNGGNLTTAGVAVSVAIVSGGGQLMGTTTRTTDASGRAEFTDLAVTGDPGSRTLGFSAPGYDGVNSSAIDVQAPPPASTTTTITGTDPSPSTVGVAVTLRFQVTSAAGTPTGSVTVTADAPGENCTDDSLEADGSGSCSITFTAAGDRALVAQYTPSSSAFTASNGAGQQHVDPATSGLTTSQDATR